MMPHPSNSGLLGGQGGGTPSQNAFPSLVSQHNSFGNYLNVLGNDPNVSSLLHQQSFGKANGGAESCPLSSVGNGTGFSTPSYPYGSSSIAPNPNSSGQFSSPVLATYQQQFNVPSNSQQQQHAHQFQAMRHGASPVNVGEQTTNGQSLHTLEPQHSDSPVFFPQQQQFPMSPQSSQPQILHQQSLMQIQQQRLLKSTPQLQSQFQQQNYPISPGPVKPVYEPGMCARRLTHYMYRHQHRPEDNNIAFWRKFVAEFFAPNAKKKWCISMYGIGRQATRVSHKDVWHCEICNRKPGRGFEAMADVLPRLFKIKYESETLNELLFVDMPREHQNSSGHIVLDYAKAIQECIFEKLRVVRDGQLRIVFSPDLKICSWEFCARRHEELIPRRLLIPPVSEVGTAAQKYQDATQNTPPSSSVSELQNNCNMFVASAHRLTKAVEAPSVNDLGYCKRYVRCLQISEVVNSMKSLIDYSSETGAGPIESLAKFPRRTNTLPTFQQQQQQQAMGQNSKNYYSSNINSAHLASMQLASTSANNSTPINSGPATPFDTTIANFLHRTSVNSRPQNPPMSNTSDVSNAVQTLSPLENNTPYPFQPPRPSSSTNNNNLQPISPVNMANSPNIGDMESSVQKFIREMLMVSDAENANEFIDGDNDILAGTEVAKGNNMSVSGFDSIRNGLGQSPMLNGNRTTLGNDYSMSMNGGAMDMSSQHNDQVSWGGHDFL